MPTTSRILQGEGTLLYYGVTKKSGAEKKCGIALESGAGKHDGQVNGTRYFTCDAGAGIITSKENVTILEEAKTILEEAKTTRKSIAKGTPKKSPKKKNKTVRLAVVAHATPPQHRPASTLRSARACVEGKAEGTGGIPPAGVSPRCEALCLHAYSSGYSRYCLALFGLRTERSHDCRQGQGSCSRG